MHSKATVYGKPGCVQCTATTKLMDKEGISYQYIDVTLNEMAHQEVKNMGYQGLPVVVSNDLKWQGFSPDKIKGLNK